MTARRLTPALIVAVVVCGGPLGAADVAMPVFPAPFSVQRQLTELGPTGSVEFQTEPVTEYYGESYLVAVRARDDRTIIDFGRREIIEVEVSKGTYWVLSFSRMRELRERLTRAGGAPREARRAEKSDAEPRVKVELVGSGPREDLTAPGGGSVFHYRASAEGRPDLVDVWLDGSVRLAKAGQDALRSFESEALGDVSTTPERAPLASLMAAVRTAGGGAFPVRTRRPLVDAGGQATGSVLEDVATKLTILPAFPTKLLTLPETLKRVPSPLEAMVAFAEDEAALTARSR